MIWRDIGGRGILPTDFNSEKTRPDSPKSFEPRAKRTCRKNRIETNRAVTTTRINNFMVIKNSAVSRGARGFFFFLYIFYFYTFNFFARARLFTLYTGRKAFRR